MRKDGSGEFYNAKQDNVFSEYKLFRAEKYYSSEFSKTPEEVQSYNESYHDEGVKSTKSEEKNSSDAKELQKQYDKLHQSGSSDAPQTSGTPSGGNPLQTTAASQTAGSVSSGVATVTGGASVGATAVAAVIIVSAAITGGFIADFNSYIGNDPGRDYISITVDMDELLSQADRSYRLSADNFSIELTEGGVSRKIALVDGKHSYLITGLQPDKTYTYNFICNNSSLGSNSNCYSQTFTTLSVAEPKGVYDELNNYVVYDEISQSATVFYSVYLSDYDRQFPDAALYLCSSEHTDLTSIDHIVYSDVAPDENGFFRGEVGGITYDELYLYVVGESTTEDGTKAVELFSIKLTLDIPEEWQAARNPAFEIDESAEKVAYYPDRLSVSGSISGLNELYDYYAYVVQYDAGGEAFAERQEADFTFDSEKMTYALDCGACYGLANYKYVIYAQDGDGNEVTVYDSGEKVFSASQAFGATYTKIEPANAGIEYTASGAIVTVDPEFTSEYENYYYKLVVTNGAGAVYGEYAGTGVAVIEIADVTGLDEIHFTYYDFGSFINGEIEYASHSTSGVTGQARFEIDESAEVLTYFPDRLSVSGSISGLNELYDYYAYVVQYDAGGEAFAERQEADFTFDSEKMTYALDCGACYGLANYKYVIYAQDGDGNEVTVYDSGEKVFSASQAFGATYTKIEPANAGIEYTASGAIVTVDPEFTSEYENYYYKLVVTNGAGAVYGEYAGTGVAVIEIADVTGLDEIHFTYYDFGSFINGEIEYARHLTEGVAFCVPTASFGSEYGFNGQYFTLSYTCDMIYDYATASMDISVSDGTHVYVKHVDGIAESGTIVLDHIEGEVGNVTVTGTLNFKDNQSDGATHSVSIDQAVYAMNYSFEVTNVLADISGFSSETMLVTLELEYRLPENYVIAISDEDNSLSFISDLTRQVSFSELPMEAEVNLTVQVMDGNGNVWGAPKTISISPSAAWAEFVYPMMCSPNPGDAVVTYNDDGTINIYRMMIPDEYGMDTVSGDERVYYNAFVQGFYLDSDGAVYTDGYDVIGRGKYAVIENIPNQNYFFIYYTMFDYNGVSYAMYAEMPSGSVENVYECGDAIVSYGDGNTIISLMVIKSGMIANYILVNGVEYEFDSYSDESDTDLIVFFEGEAEVREVTILFTAQGYNYDEYAASGEITMKGNKYASHVIQVIFAEM